MLQWFIRFCRIYRMRLHVGKILKCIACFITLTFTSCATPASILPILRTLFRDLLQNIPSAYYSGCIISSNGWVCWEFTSSRLDAHSCSKPKTVYKQFRIELRTNSDDSCSKAKRVEKLFRIGLRTNSDDSCSKAKRVEKRFRIGLRTNSDDS